MAIIQKKILKYPSLGDLQLALLFLKALISIKQPVPNYKVYFPVSEN